MTLITYLAAVTAFTGAALASPFPSAATDMDSHALSNITWTGIIEGNAYELHGDASVRHHHTLPPLNILFNKNQEVIAQLEATYPGIRHQHAARAASEFLEMQPRNKEKVICVPVPGQENPQNQSFLSTMS